MVKILTLIVRMIFMTTPIMSFVHGILQYCIDLPASEELTPCCYLLQQLTHTSSCSPHTDNNLFKYFLIIFYSL